MTLYVTVEFAGALLSVKLKAAVAAGLDWMLGLICSPFLCTKYLFAPASGVQLIFTTFGPNTTT